MKSLVTVQHVLARCRARTLVSGSATALTLWLLLSFTPLPAMGQPTDEETLFTIAVQAYRDGLLELARDQLQAYLAQYPGGKHQAEVHYLLGDFFYRQGDYPLAARHLQVAVQSQPQRNFHDEARYLLGRSQFASGRYGEAAQTLRPLITPGHHSQWSEAALYWSGEALLSAGDVQGAARLLQQLVEQPSTSEYREFALYSLGYAWQKLDAHQESLHIFQRLLQDFPQSQLRRSAEYGMARALVSLQRYAEAAPHWQRLQEQAGSPEQAEEATFWWAASWVQAGRCDQAAPVVQSYLQRFPRGPQRATMLVTLGNCWHDAGQFTAAIQPLEDFLRAFPAEPRRDPVLLSLADAYQHTGQLAKAEERYTQWLAAFPHDARRAEVLTQRGIIRYRLEDHARAAQDLQEALPAIIDPQRRLLAHELLAASYVHLEDCAAALPHLSFVIEHGAAAAQLQARLRRGLCAYRNQQFAVAVQDLRQLVDDPEFRGEQPRLHLLLGYSHAALEEHDDAVAHFRQYLAAPVDKPEASQALAGLAASLLKTDQIAAARSVYEQLLAGTPVPPEKERLHLQLALLYQQSEAVEKAKHHLQAAAQGNDQAVAAEALYRLADLMMAEDGRDEGTALLQKLTQQFASQPRWVGIAHYRLALTYEAAERWREAWQAYNAAAETANDAKLVEAARQRAKHLEETVDGEARPQPASEHEPSGAPDPAAAKH
jgi:TolA-binding protein